MNCHNCEIPLGWDGISPIVICEICRAYRFVDVPDDSGRTIVPMNPAGSCFCPCCRRRLYLAAMDGLKVEHCAACEGVLMTNEIFAMFVRNRRSEFREAASQPIVLVGEHRGSKRCPHCRRGMGIHPCYGPDLIIVESCRGCGMVWLDCRDMASSSVLSDD
ncbi:MAG: hypothetical protein JSS49_15205 [Planctomycetes bacterium]|nr:hypothetical protein [Planctomycetota bacterium]